MSRKKDLIKQKVIRIHQQTCICRYDYISITINSMYKHIHIYTPDDCTKHEASSALELSC